MPLKDLIQNQLTAEDITNINTAIAQIETILAGKTVNLTPDERQRYGSINEQNKLFVNKVDDYRVSNEQFNSAQVDWSEFSSDLETRQVLGNIINRLNSLTEQFTDTKILHDNDNYQQALSQYSYISYLAEQSVPGITAVKEDLAQFFPRTGGATNNAQEKAA